MVKKAVQTSYRKVKREDRPKPVKKCKGRAKGEGTLSPLSIYIMQNLDSGLSRRELVEQYHEYDCKGKMVEHLGVITCSKCDYWEPNRATHE